MLKMKLYLLEYYKKSVDFFKDIMFFLSAILPMSIISLVKFIFIEVYNIEENSCKIKEINVQIILIFYCLFIIVGVGFLIILLLKKDDKNVSAEGNRYKILKIENETESIGLGYYSIFVLTSLSIPNINLYVDFSMFLFCIIVLGVIYCKHEMFYINIGLLLFGKKIYVIEAENTIDKKIQILYLIANRNARFNKYLSFKRKNLLANKRIVFLKNNQLKEESEEDEAKDKE